MDAKLTFVKDPTHHRIIALILLSLAGLGHFPNFCEGIKCYACGVENQPKCSSDPKPGELDCASNCQVKSQSGQIAKDCGNESIEKLIDCLKTKLGQSEPCIKVQQNIPSHVEVFQECRQENKTVARSEQQDKSEEYVHCLCTTDLCNVDELLNSAPPPSAGLAEPPPSPIGPPVVPGPLSVEVTEGVEGRKAASGGAQAVLDGRNVVQVGIAGVIMILW